MNRTFLGDNPTWGRKFQSWRETSKTTCTRLRVGVCVGVPYTCVLTSPPQLFCFSQQDFNKLENQIMVRGRVFAYNFLKSARRRLQPYWSALMACELANPSSPSRISPSAWGAVKDLCERVGMESPRADAVVWYIYRLWCFCFCCVSHSDYLCSRDPYYYIPGGESSRSAWCLFQVFRFHRTSHALKPP